MRRLLSLLLILTPCPTYAGVWHVAQDGSGDFSVIQDAANAAAPGDTILLYPGRYLEYEPFFFGALTESTFVVIDKPDITIRGTDRDSVIIGPEVNRWAAAFAPNGIAQTTNSTNIVVENLTVENIPEGIVLENSAVVQDVRLKGCASGLSSWSFDAIQVQRVEIENCWSLGLVSWGPASGGQFVDIVASGSFSLLFSGGDQILVDRATLLGGSGIRFQSQTSGSIRNSLLDGGSIVVLMSTANLQNCRVTPNTQVALEASESTIVASQCIFGGGAQATLSLRAESSVTIHNSHLLHSGLPAVDVRFYDGTPGPTIDLTNNWWGTSDPSLVADWIIDANDFPDRGEVVLFEPIATERVGAGHPSIGFLKSLFAKPKDGH